MDAVGVRTRRAGDSPAGVPSRDRTRQRDGEGVLQRRWAAKAILPPTALAKRAVRAQHERRLVGGRKGPGSDDRLSLFLSSSLSLA